MRACVSVYCTHTLFLFLSFVYASGDESRERCDDFTAVPAARHTKLTLPLGAAERELTESERDWARVGLLK